MDCKDMKYDCPIFSNAGYVKIELSKEHTYHRDCLDCIRGELREHFKELDY